MSRLLHALNDMLIQRSRRERWLLGVMVLVAVPFLYVYGVVLPLNERHMRAQAALEEAAALERWLHVRRAELQSLPPPPEDAPGTDAARPVPGLGEIETRLEEAGLQAAASQIATADEGGVELRMEDAAFTGLMAWLDALEAETGYQVARMTLQRGSRSGLVEADILLRPR